MANLVGKINSLASGLLDDDNKLDAVLGKGFTHFDKDGSGYIEADEINAAVQHLLTIAHLPHVPSQLLDGVVNKVTGPDGKIDKAEFRQLFRRLLAKIHGNPEPVAEAAAAVGYDAE